MYYIRINAEWDEELFIKMEQLLKSIIEDYADEDFYPKRLISYYMIEIPSIINMLSHFKRCTEKDKLAGYTEETYLSMISQRIEQLEKLRWDFIDSL